MRFCPLFASLVFAACGQPTIPDASDAGANPADGGSTANSADASPSTRPDATTGTLIQDLYQSGTRIKARMLVSGDGAKEFRGWRDTQRNEDCTFLTTSQGTTRCLPFNDGRALTTYFSDASCTTPGALYAKTCPAPAYLLSYESGCGNIPVTGVYRSGSRGPTYYVRAADGTCTPQTAGTGYDVVAAGEQIPLTDFVEATETLE